MMEPDKKIFICKHLRCTNILKDQINIIVRSF
jgi:hypothetical protein